MPQLITDGFGEGDDDIVVEILKKWKGGPLSDKLFTVLAGIIPHGIVEVVIMREREGAIEALIIPRPPGDIVWPGKFHTPGQALRRADYDRPEGYAPSGPFERVRMRELGGVEYSTPPTFAGYICNASERGAAITLVFWATIPEDSDLPEGTRWADVEQLPHMPEFIQSQMSFLPIAIEAFSERNSRY